MFNRTPTRLTSAIVEITSWISISLRWVQPACLDIWSMPIWPIEAHPSYRGRLG